MDNRIENSQGSVESQGINNARTEALGGMSDFQNIRESMNSNSNTSSLPDLQISDSSRSPQGQATEINSDARGNNQSNQSDGQSRGDQSQINQSGRDSQTGEQAARDQLQSPRNNPGTNNEGGEVRDPSGPRADETGPAQRDGGPSNEAPREQQARPESGAQQTPEVPRDGSTPTPDTLPQGQDGQNQPRRDSERGEAPGAVDRAGDAAKKAVTSQITRLGTAAGMTLQAARVAAGLPGVIVGELPAAHWDYWMNKTPEQRQAAHAAQSADQVPLYDNRLGRQGAARRAQDESARAAAAR